MAEQDSRERKYYVLRVISGKEDKVKEMLEREREIAPLKGYLFDVFIPTEKVMMQRGSKKRIVERPSMPGYMVIEAILNNDNIFILRNLPNVVGFLGMPKPEPLPLYEVERMMRKQDDRDEDATYDITFLEGDSVKVVDGPFTGFSATIEEVYQDKKKLKVMVKIFGRKTPLELSYTQVEKE